MGDLNSGVDFHILLKTNHCGQLKSFDGRIDRGLALRERAGESERIRIFNWILISSKTIDNELV